MEDIKTIADKDSVTVKSITATIYMRGSSNPIVIEGLKSFNWKKIPGELTSLEWEFQDKFKLKTIGFIDLKEIVFVLVEQLI